MVFVFSNFLFLYSNEKNTFKNCALQRLLAKRKPDIMNHDDKKQKNLQKFYVKVKTICVTFPLILSF